MICPNCQKEISNDSTFCFNCGVLVRQSDVNQEINKENFSEEIPNLNGENTTKTNSEQSVSENQIQSDYASPTDVPHYTYNSDTKPNIPEKDPGELYAILSLVFGILSMFSGPIFSILSLVFVKQYHKEGSGLEESKVKAGKVLSIISLVISVLSILAILFYYGIMFSLIFYGSNELATLSLT